MKSEISISEERLVAMVQYFPSMVASACKSRGVDITELRSSIRGGRLSINESGEFVDNKLRAEMFNLSNAMIKLVRPLDGK